MLINFDEASSDIHLSTDVCIVGAGAAGITLALELISSGLNILLIDAGGFSFSDDSQSLYRMERTAPYPDPTVSRVRYFGGSTNHWNGSCRTFDPIDFERRAWVPDSGWPIGFQELAPYYDRAFPYIEAGPRYVDETKFTSVLGQVRQKLGAAGLSVRLGYNSPPTQFGVRYYARLHDAPNVTVMTRANLCSINETENRQAVKSLTLSNYRHRTASVTAKIYVIALGGIENARALLLSDQITPGGIGNEHDNVGRYFMDHPVVQSEVFHPSAGFARAWQNANARRELALQASESTLRKYGLTNARLTLAWASEIETSEGVESSHQIGAAMSNHKAVAHIWEHLWNILRDSDVEVTGWLEREGYIANGPSKAFGGYIGEMMLEQRPNRDNRIILTQEKDVLGLRKGKILWRFPQNERRDYQRLIEVMTKGMGSQGLSLAQSLMNLDDSDRYFGELLNFGHHHMGTTRASLDPKNGVVDAHQRIHGRANIYMAGSSVFPTGSHVPPTTTIVAMTIRLADHLLTRVL